MHVVIKNAVAQTAWFLQNKGVYRKTGLFKCHLDSEVGVIKKHSLGAMQLHTR